MDPNANLAEQRALVERLNHAWDCSDLDGLLPTYEANQALDAAFRLSELVQALDEWIVSGGFLPTAWSTK